MDLMIKDNFLPIPHVIRSWILQQEFYDCAEMSRLVGKTTTWPGLRTRHVMDLDTGYADMVLGTISNLLRPYLPSVGVGIESHFQLTDASDGDSWVHQDNDVLYAGVLYLTPNPPVDSGTIVYRCNDKPAWESLMETQEGFQKMLKINSQEDTISYQRLFTPIDTIGNVFNRLILYRGDLYHKSNRYFGTTKSNSRLTQVFFIRANT
jgi:hypothetical protein